MLNSTRRQSRLERAKVEHYLQVEREAVEKKNERERLITRLKLYEAQLKEREEPDSEGTYMYRYMYIRVVQYAMVYE